MRFSSRFISVALVAAHLLWTIVLQAQQPAPEADLSRVRAFYLSASYEDALAALDAISKDVGSEQVDQYRALCFMALGRKAEAERALERIVLRNPAYAMTETEVSPRLVHLFGEIRGRTLPSALRQMYSLARTDYEARDFAAAADRLRRVIQLVTDEESGELSGLADLRHLSEGFLQLTEGELASAAERKAAEARSAGESVNQAKIYSASDHDVVAPAEVEWRLPPWLPRTDALRRATLTGLLEIVVDASGAVESAVLVRPLSPQYDPSLIAAAKSWRFRPAIKDGQAVRFRKQIQIVLEPPKS